MHTLRSSRLALTAIMERIEADPQAVLHGRVSLPGREKAFVALRGLAGLDARRVARGVR